MRRSHAAGRFFTARPPGQTLIELIVALAILAVVVPVSLRLFFLTDRALGPQSARAEATGGQAQLMDDLGRDVRQAQSATGNGALSVVTNGRRVTYRWSAERQATVRECPGQPGEMREYPGIRVEFSPQGRLVQVRLRGSGAMVSTAYLMRNP